MHGSLRGVKDRGVVAHDGHRFAAQHVDVGFGAVVAERDGVAGLSTSEQRPTPEHGGEPQVGHQLDDPLGHGRFGFRRSDLVNGVASFAWKHGVKPGQKHLVVVEHGLQVRRHGHAVFAMIHGQIDVNPSAVGRLGFLQLGPGHHHEPPAVARAEQPAMPGGHVVDSDDVALFRARPHLVFDRFRDAQKVHGAIHLEALDWRRKAPGFGRFTHCILKLIAGRMRVLHNEGRSIAATHSPKASNSRAAMRGTSTKTGTAST